MYAVHEHLYCRQDRHQQSPDTNVKNIAKKRNKIFISQRQKLLLGIH